MGDQVRFGSINLNQITDAKIAQYKHWRGAANQQKEATFDFTETGGASGSSGASGSGGPH